MDMTKERLRAEARSVRELAAVVKDATTSRILLILAKEYEDEANRIKATPPKALIRTSRPPLTASPDCSKATGLN
jgi:hypothetical protein